MPVPPDPHAHAGAVRVATPADAEVFAALNAAIQRPHHRADPGTYRDYDSISVVPFFSAVLEVEGNYGFLAHADTGEPVGYALLQTIHRVANPFAHATRFLELDQIAVLEAHQNRGYAWALVERIKQLAAELRIARVELTVRSFNRRALEAYERYGFTEVSRRLVLVDLDPRGGARSLHRDRLG
ncbi:MAG: GNAT family N-acetyltransferase [Nannocystaceae bacterium]